MDVVVLAGLLGALGHPVRLRLLMVLTGGDMYLSELAGVIGVSRALALVHLKKLVKFGLVDTRVVLMGEEARARRYYSIRDFEVHVSPELLALEVENDGL